MVDFFLVKYFCTRSDDKPGQEVKIFFVITHLDLVGLQHDAWW